MLMDWVVEIAKALGRLFINPLLYWSFILIFISGYYRIKRERFQFGTKIFDLFSEWKNTWVLAICSGLVISLLMLGIGVVFSFEMMLLLGIVTIFVSMSGRFSLLSASYTLGITYIILLFSPLLLKQQTFIDEEIFSTVNFTGIAILLGLLLLVESILISRVQRNELFPSLTTSDRGVWVGQHHLQKLGIIPFFVLIPAGLIEPFAPFWPYLSIGENSYGLLLFPFVLGFDYGFVSGPFPTTINSIGKAVRRLGFAVLLIAAGSIYLSWLSIIAVLFGLIGIEVIKYRHRISEQKKRPYFNQMEQGLKVLAVIPDGPADRLGILAGETIYRVNHDVVTSSDEFYKALQASGANFRLEILDDREEVRFIQSALYDGEHHKLGIVFVQKPYRHEKTG